MENKPILIYKNIGETPLQAVEKLRIKYPEYSNLPMTYAGRLDPLVEGLLLVFIGDDCKKKDEYLGLSKEYEVEILFGFETDTYDLLGIVKKETNEQKYIIPVSFNKFFSNFIGDISQEYPSYSSKTVNGKPLWQWAREGRLNEIEFPKHIVKIESINIVEEKIISKNDLGKYIEKVIPMVKGDFRQDEIIEKWREALTSSPYTEFNTMKIKVSCGSGAYMRVLAHDIGKVLDISSLAYHIKRTKIGDYSI